MKIKILLVSIPSLHFFSWVDQLKESDYELYWFDITDGGSKVDKINWVNQIKSWKLRIKYPFRYKIKSKYPKVYSFIQKYNERDLETVFLQKIKEINPDIVHSFEMKLTGLPILELMNSYKNYKWIYSSWGSDMYYYENLGLKKNKVEEFLNRVDFLITDCFRDYNIALKNGFDSTFLGVYPGNGGIKLYPEFILSIEDRNLILIKGYDDGVGKSLKVIEAIELIDKSYFKNYQLIIYSADNSVIDYITRSNYFSDINFKIISRKTFLNNVELLKLMGKSVIHIANSLSDGLPNALLEAMGMGAFPIQSNPGGVTCEVLENGKNGYLIDNPLNEIEISELIKSALNNRKLRFDSMTFNVGFIKEKYNKDILKSKIIDLYQDVHKTHLNSNKI